MFAINNKTLIRTLLAAMLLLPSLTVMAASNKPEPVTVTADDAQLSKPDNISTYTGNVVVVRGTLTLKGDKLVVSRLQNGEYKAVLTGQPSTLRREPAVQGDKLVTGHSHEIIYYTGKAEVTLRGDAVVDREGDIIHSQLIRHDLNAEKTYAGDPNSDSDRVKVTLLPSDNGAAK